MIIKINIGISETDDKNRMRIRTLLLENCMLRYILLLLALPLLLLAQEQGARINFQHDKADAGKIEQGEIAEHVFPFVNDGSDTLRISNVYSS
jgi:hypothetical protein